MTPLVGTWTDAGAPVLLGALICAVATDLLYRRIPNWLVLSLLSLWLARTTVLLWTHGLPNYPKGELTGLLMAIFVLAGGYALFIMRWVGAGDVKLAAVLSLWLAASAPAFLMVTSLAGGLLVVLMPAVRVLEALLAWLIHGINLALPRLRIPLPVSFGPNPVQGLPYGLAIAAGAVCVISGI